jgi:phosphatidylethanolamine-binding protein (PEBP) family uncharacterized protein
MSDNHDELDRQIAGLEDALKLPLPDATRAQLQQDLERLRARQAASSGGSIQGTADVSGTLYGNAIGVNLGTVQAYFGPQPPAGSGNQPPPQVSQEEIDDQRELLEAHRRTLAIYLKQQAQLGSAYAPPGVANGIREARDGIRRVKATLRGWGLEVAAYPDD